MRGMIACVSLMTFGIYVESFGLVGDCLCVMHPTTGPRLTGIAVAEGIGGGSVLFRSEHLLNEAMADVNFVQAVGVVGWTVAVSMVVSGK